MEKTYQPQHIERSHYERWETKGYFTPSGKGEPYAIMIPPPNVTGSLHMGHAFQQTIMDALIRYQRMMGKNTLWQTGSDHAGIATQMVVERELAREGKTRHDLGREAFIDRVWQWKEQSGNQISGQMRRLGDSVDWCRERFTMDEGLSKAVREVFVRLHEEGLIYRGKRLVNWDPKFHTSISDLEVENHEEQGSLWHFRYPLNDGATTADGKPYLVIATTRPETLLGDTALAVHPEDERYQHLIGHSVQLPLVNRRLPIIADDYVDPEFGTGCVKITPAHDFNDYEVGKRHGSLLINIFDENAAVLDKACAYNYQGQAVTNFDGQLPEGYSGIDRFAARQKIVTELDTLGLVEAIEPHRLMVPRGDRSGAVIEPWLTDQWYVATKPLAEPAIAAVKNGDIELVPKQWENTFFAWMNDVQDWCISRQLWWGHQIPAWYDNQGNVYVGRDEQAVREQHQLGDDVALKQDEDVLDTWFSSALWTFSTLGWPEDKAQLATFHPTQVLVTGFDIIFFWVARMMMMTLHFIKDDNGQPQVPFKQVYFTGLIRDENGQKMSKSKGNVIDPIDLIDGISVDELVAKRTHGLMQPKLAAKIEKNTRRSFPEGMAASGTDALRFTLTSLASQGRDINFDTKRLEGYRNFCNKIWNAARYVLMNTEGEDCGQNGAGFTLSLADRWIISVLQRLETDVHRHFSNYRFDLLSQALYDFIWNQYCDWYLELSKPILSDEQADSRLKIGTRRTLVRVLETLLRLAHPIIPFISEEIWQSIKTLAGKSGDTLMLQPYPQPDDSKLDAEAEADIDWLKGIIVGVRNIRGEMNLAPAKALPLLLQKGDEQDQRRLQHNQGLLTSLAKLESITLLAEDEVPPPSATQLVGHLKVLVPMKGLIDVEAEQKRLAKTIEKTQQELSRVEAKLANAHFAERAPADVVAQEKTKAANLAERLSALQTQRQELNELK